MVYNENAVIIYFNGSFVNLENGAHYRVDSLIRYIADLSDNTIVYSYINHPTCPWGITEIEKFYNDYPNVELILEKFTLTLQLWTSLKYIAFLFIPKLARHLTTIALPFVSPAFFKISQKVSNPLYIINYARGITQLNGIKGGALIVETHDISFLNDMKQRNESISDLKTMLKARAELSLLANTNKLLAISPPEANIFRTFLPQIETLYVPVYQKSSRNQLAVPVDRIQEEKKYDILFVGSENYLNVSGIVTFINEHELWLKNKTFAIAGKICLCPIVMEAAKRVGAILLGYVMQLNDIYNASRLVISPVDGTGLKIKVIEALSAGKPVFGSLHTLAALPPGFDGCVFPIDEDAMDELICNAVARHNVELKSLEYAESLAEKGDIALLENFLRNYNTKYSIGENRVDHLDLSY